MFYLPMEIDVDTPPEPTALRRSIADRASEAQFTLTDELEWVVPIAEPAPGRVVLGSDISAYLWRAWESDLRSAGFTYQEFTTGMAYAAEPIAAWATSDAEWEAACSSLVTRLKDVGPQLLTDLSATATE